MVIIMIININNDMDNHINDDADNEHDDNDNDDAYFSALFRPSVTASFLAFSMERAFDLIPSHTPYPTSSWKTPSYKKNMESGINISSLICKT